MSFFEYLQDGKFIAAAAVMSFSAIAGYSIGFALRFVMKILLVIIGVILIAIFILQYAEIIASVDWKRITELFQIAAQKLQQEGIDFFDYMKHQLPQATVAAAGIYYGFRRKP